MKMLKCYIYIYTEGTAMNIRHSKVKSYICAAAAATDLVLFFIKLYVAISSNSIGIYVDSLNSLADTLVCIIAVIGFRVAVIEPNEKYPFGFGRIEEVVNFLLSAVILFTGLAFTYTSLQRLLYPVPVWYMLKYALLVAVTAAVKLMMSFGFGYADRKLNSQVLKNLRTDSILDFFISSCIVISFTLTEKLGYSVDSLTGIAASLVITVSGIKSIVLAISSLIGKADKAQNDSASALINSVEGIELKEIYCHCYGDRKIFNAVINADSLDEKKRKDIINILQTRFKAELSAELFIRLED